MALGSGAGPGLVGIANGSEWMVAKITGLMVISMKPAIFATIHSDPFTIPTNPGPAPDPNAIAAASSATKNIDLYKAYALHSNIYSEFIAAERISVKLALDLIAKIYYKAFKKTHTSYANVTLRQLLNHLATTYAATNQFDLEKNQENMTAHYNPNAPIKTIFEQITDGVAYAELGTHPSRQKRLWTLPSYVWQKRGCFTTI